MADLSCRRSDEFSHFIAVLQFGAVDLDDGAWIIEEVLGSCLHDARFARSRWSEEKESGNRPAGRCHSGHIHLIYVGNLFRLPPPAQQYGCGDALPGLAPCIPSWLDRV